MEDEPSWFRTERRVESEAMQISKRTQDLWRPCFSFLFLGLWFREFFLSIWDVKQISIVNGKLLPSTSCIMWSNSLIVQLVKLEAHWVSTPLLTNRVRIPGAAARHLDAPALVRRFPAWMAVNSQVRRERRPAASGGWPAGCKACFPRFDLIAAELCWLQALGPSRQLWTGTEIPVFIHSGVHVRFRRIDFDRGMAVSCCIYVKPFLVSIAKACQISEAQSLLMMRGWKRSRTENRVDHSTVEPF